MRETTENLHFYRCSVCGNLILKLIDSKVQPQCCGRDMEELIPNRTDATEEKHVPYWEADKHEVSVEIGSEPHPHTEEHYIQYIIVVTNYAVHMKRLNPGDEPKACFMLCKNEKVETVYEYCNIHGLWKSDKEGEADATD